MSSLFPAMTRFLLLPLAIEAAALLLKGGTGTGGGFSAAVVAALTVLLYQMAFRTRDERPPGILQCTSTVAIVGLAFAVIAALAPLAVGAPALSQSPPIDRPAAHFGILELRTQLLFEISVALVVYAFIVEAAAAIADIQGATP